VNTPVASRTQKTRSQKTTRARAALFLLPIGAALVLAGAGGASGSSLLPSVYFNYTSSCHFTAVTDSGASLGPGTAIPYGTYQVVVNTPFPFSDGQASCDFVNFQLTGPGVNYSTQLGQGDADQEVTTQNFVASSSYTASDSTVAPGTSLAFGTSATPVATVGGSSSAGSSGTSGSSGSSGSQSTLGGSASTGSTVRGDLLGTVSSAGELKLILKGKPVATLPAGRYTVMVDDQSPTEGFILQAGGHAPMTITTGVFKGKRSLTVNLTIGQWQFYGRPGAARIYFVATG